MAKAKKTKVAEEPKNKLYVARLRRNGQAAGAISYSETTGKLELEPTPNQAAELEQVIEQAVYYNVYDDKTGEQIDQIVVDPSAGAEYVKAFDKAVLGHFSCDVVDVFDED